MFTIPHIQSIRPLRDLPNEAGFKFVGVAKNFERFECSVKVAPDTGLHSVQGADYSELLGWVPVCK